MTVAMVAVEARTKWPSRRQLKKSSRSGSFAYYDGEAASIVGVSGNGAEAAALGVSCGKGGGPCFGVQGVSATVGSKGRSGFSSVSEQQSLVSGKMSGKGYRTFNQVVPETANPVAPETNTPVASKFRVGWTVSMICW